MIKNQNTYPQIPIILWLSSLHMYMYSKSISRTLAIIQRHRNIYTPILHCVILCVFRVNPTERRFPTDI